MNFFGRNKNQVDICGSVAHGFEEVATLFRENFEWRGVGRTLCHLPSRSEGLVIAAGGHSKITEESLSDALFAFTLT
jgi:hypothetical protein